MSRRSCSTRARIFDRGHGRKNDPADAKTTAVVALRTKGLRQVVPDDEMVALRLLSERRRDLVRTRTATVNHLHQLLMELIAAGSDRKLTAAKAKALLATIRPRDVAGRTRRQLAVDLVEDVVALDRKLKDLDKRLKDAVADTGTSLLQIKGVGVTTAAMILGEVGDVRRFPSRHHFATYTGTAPREFSSGGVDTHRLSRAGNRKLNHALHIIALSHKRHDEQGGAYYSRKLAAGKGKKGALRSLKRRLSDVVFRTLVADRELADKAREQAAEVAGPGGQSGATTKSCAADRSPMISTSEKPLAGPASPDATRHRRACSSPCLTQRGAVSGPPAALGRPSRGIGGGSRLQRPHAIAVRPLGGRGVAGLGDATGAALAGALEGVVLVVGVGAVGRRVDTVAAGGAGAAGGEGGLAAAAKGDRELEAGGGADGHCDDAALLDAGGAAGDHGGGGDQDRLAVAPVVGGEHAVVVRRRCRRRRTGARC